MKKSDYVAFAERFLVRVFGEYPRLAEFGADETNFLALDAIWRGQLQSAVRDQVILGTRLAANRPSLMRALRSQIELATTRGGYAPRFADLSVPILADAVACSNLVGDILKEGPEPTKDEPLEERDVYRVVREANEGEEESLDLVGVEIGEAAVDGFISADATSRLIGAAEEVRHPYTADGLHALSVGVRGRPSGLLRLLAQANPRLALHNVRVSDKREVIAAYLGFTGAGLTTRDHEYLAGVIHTARTKPVDVDGEGFCRFMFDKVQSWGSYPTPDYIKSVDGFFGILTRFLPYNDRILHCVGDLRTKVQARLKAEEPGFRHRLNTRFVDVDYLTKGGAAKYVKLQHLYCGLERLQHRLEELRLAPDR